MININILKKGDEVIAVNEKFLAVRRKTGEVDIFNIMYNENNEVFIDPVKAAVIGFGEGTVEKKLDDGETTVYTF